MNYGIQPANFSLGMGSIAMPTPIALNFAQAPTDLGRMPLLRALNVHAERQPSVSASHGGSQTPDARKASHMRADFTGIGSGKDAAESGIGPRTPGCAIDGGGIDATDARVHGRAPQRAQPVLCPSAAETLYVCAGVPDAPVRGGVLAIRNHPVLMPGGRSERAQVCRDIVNGSMLGTEGRNGTVSADVAPSRDDVTRTLLAAAQRWTGHSTLVGKKVWAKACDEFDSPAKFIGNVNEQLHAGQRVLPSRESTGWMLRVGFASSLPMHQAMVRADLPASVGLGSEDWIKLSLAIEQLGDAHWEMRHDDVMAAAALPATDTKAFTALATSVSSRPAHVATQRLRNQLTQRGMPTAPAASTGLPAA